MGLVLADIGSHSFRKGIATFLSGMPGGPSPVSIYLRAGWSLGPVQARYILGGGGGDQLCGRAATGISLNDPAFADLPPHFDLSKGAVLTTQEWEEILPGYSTFYPQSFRTVVPFLLASLIHHRKWLEETLPANSVLFNVRVWNSGKMDELRTKVHTGRMCHTETLLSATGIPPHVVLANRMALMQDEIHDLRGELHKAIEELPPKVRDEIVNNMTIEGVVPITPAQINGIMANFRDEVLVAIQNSRSATTAQGSNVPQAVEHDGVLYGDYYYWFWGGRMHPVPESFEFPLCDVHTMWDLWLDGKKSQRIKPYRFLKGYDLTDVTQRARLSKANGLMKTLIKLTEKKASEIAPMNANERDILFAATYKSHWLALNPGCTEEYYGVHRAETQIYTSIYETTRAKKRLMNVDDADTHDDAN